MTSRTRYPSPLTEARVFQHAVAETGLAEDGALVELLDRYPADLFDINLYDYDDEGQVSLRTGVRGRLGGEELLEAIKRGRLWVNLRGIEDAHPALWERIRDAFADIRRQIPGLKPVRMTGQLILSSPGTKVPYHFDPAGVVLFHLRGKKRLFVYPGDEAHLPEASMEKVVMRQTTEEIPYRRDFDTDAQVFDLEPGQALAWPLYAPHRVENLGAFNVSLSMDYQTWSSRLRNGALYTHGVMRGRGMAPRATDRLGAGGLAARWATAAMLKRAGLRTDQIAVYERHFEPAVDAVDGAGALR